MMPSKPKSLPPINRPFFVFYILIDFGTWRDSMEDLIPPRFPQRRDSLAFREDLYQAGEFILNVDPGGIESGQLLAYCTTRVQATVFARATSGSPTKSSKSVR